MELIRVLKRIWGILILLTVSIIGLCNFQIQNSNDVKIYYYYEDMIECFKNIENENAQGQTDETKIDYQTIESLVYKDVKKDIENNSDREYIEEADSLFHNNVEYIYNYKNNIINNISRSSNILSSSLYSDKNNFGRLNTIKYANDMLKVKDKPVSLSNTTAIEKLLGFNELPLLFVLMILVVIFTFMEESYNGMVMIIRSGSHGRFRLILKRCLILLLFTAILSFIVNAFAFMTFLFSYGGRSDLIYAIQSSQVFKLFPLNVNVIQFFLLYCVWFTFGMYGIGAFMYMIMLLVKSNKFAIVIMMGIFAVEYILFKNISSNSSLCILKYINLFCMIIPGSSYLKYENWGYNGFVTDISSSTMIMTFIIMVICTATVLAVYTLQHMANGTGWIKKFQDKMIVLFQKVFSKTNLFIMELYKIIFLQRGLIIIIIAVYLLSNCKLYRGVDYSGNNNYLTSFYNTFEGRIPDEEMDSYIENEQSKIDEIKNMQNLTGIQKWQLSDMKAALNEMKNSVQYITRINSEQNIEAVIINPRTYNDILGQRNYSNLESINLICILAIILILGGVFSFEKKSGMFVLGRTSSKRKRVWYNKAAIVFIVTLIIWLLSSVLNWRNINELYTLNQVNAPIQSLEVYENFLIKINIMDYLVICQIIRLAQLLGIGYIVFGISIYMDYIKSVLVALFILFPHLLYIFKIPFMNYLSIVISLDFNRYWREYGNNGANYLLCFILIISSGILGYKCFQKWNRSGRRNAIWS